MSDPDNHTLRLLKKIRDEVKQTREDLTRDLANLDRKVDLHHAELTKRIDSVKQLAYGESILARYAVAEVEPRLFRLEEYIALRRE